jgi:hypothetical protein
MRWNRLIGLFATMPYGRFAHAIFRAAAVLKLSIGKPQRQEARHSEPRDL